MKRRRPLSSAPHTWHHCQGCRRLVLAPADLLALCDRCVQRKLIEMEEYAEEQKKPLPSLERR